MAGDERLPAGWGVPPEVDVVSTEAGWRGGDERHHRPDQQVPSCMIGHIES